MEITLFDRKGHATAYIADDGEGSIYTWDGHAVAYVNNEAVHGWNGRHLGWFIGGVLYDLHGLRSGFTRERCPVATYAEPAKYAKYAKYARYAAYAPYARPGLSSGYSDEDLEDLVLNGKVG